MGHAKACQGLLLLGLVWGSLLLVDEVKSAESGVGFTVYGDLGEEGSGELQ